jgi:2-polyprenyl-6-methoxyphenol hydroxylase-like FAD-dependent oxidoreductase
LRQRVSTLFGFLLNRAALPEPGFGHVFLGGPGPVLAYAVSKSAVRVMFDVPDATLGPHRLESCRESLPALPEPLRSQVAERLEQPGIVGSASYRASVRQVNIGRLVLVGDAAGCCHPLTATGLTVCARDALRLRDALRDTDGDIERALPLYALRRRGPQRTRMMLAQVLYEVFCGDAPESRLVRNGLRKYWDGDRRRCAKSLSLVSTEDGRLSFMLLELARVTLSGFSTCISRPWRQGGFSPVGSGLLLGLYRLLLRHAGETLRIT